MPGEESGKPSRKQQMEAQGQRKKFNSHMVLGRQKLVFKAAKVKGPWYTSSFQLRSQRALPRSSGKMEIDYP